MLDILVPIMAVCYFVITIVIILLNIRSLPGVFERIIQEAFGIRQAAAGGFGAVLMNGVKEGYFPTKRVRDQHHAQLRLQNVIRL